MKRALVVVLIAVLGMTGVSAFAVVGANPPPTPGNVRTLTILENSINWGWNQVGQADGYEVFAGLDSAPPGTPNATIAPKTKTDWAYSGLIANTQYCFQLDAYNNQGKSNKSGLLKKYTLATAPFFGLSGNGAIKSNMTSGGTYRVNNQVKFNAVNGFGIGAAKASKYRYVWDNSASAPNWASASTWTLGTLQFTPTTAGTWYLHLQALNGDDTANSATLLGTYNIVIPEPSGLLALGCGIFGLAGFFRRRK